MFLQRTLWLLTLAMLFPVDALADDSETKILSEQMSVAYANSEAWRKYDFLLQETKFYKGSRPEGSPEASTRWIRCAIDWDVGEVFCFVRVEVDGVDAKEQKPVAQPVKKMYQHLVVKSGDVSRNRILPKRSQPLLVNDLRRVFNFFEVDVPDLRYVGIQPYSVRHNSVQSFEEVIAERITRINAPAALPSNKTITRDRNSLTVTTDLHDFGRAASQFDASTLMKERTYWWMLEEPNVKRADQIISWLEKDGVFVPIEISIETNEPQWSEFSTVAIYWRSLNEPLERTLFDPKFLDDVGNVMKCIDVEAFKEAGCLNK